MPRHDDAADDGNGRAQLARPADAARIARPERDDDGRARLARFLRDRRGRLDPAACGFARGRRRTPGLRREEVAQLADISVTWYTWLEQGRRRTAVPSADALDGIASALRLGRAERDHLFLLAHGRLPPRSAAEAAAVPPALRQGVDGLGQPALVRTIGTWDVVAWNRSAAAVFGDYAAVPPAGRNVLRRLFTDPAARAAWPEWDRDARRLVAVLRGDCARIGPSPAVDRLIADLSDASPEFARWWADDWDVAADTEGTKRMYHPAVGAMSFAYTVLTPAAADGLAVTVFMPATADDGAAVAHLLAEAAGSIRAESHE